MEANLETASQLPGAMYVSFRHGFWCVCVCVRVHSNKLAAKQQKDNTYEEKNFVYKKYKKKASMKTQEVYPVTGKLR